MILWDPQNKTLLANDKKAILSNSENDLVRVFYFMGRRFVDHYLLVEVIFGDLERKLYHQGLIGSRVARIRRKIGEDFIKNHKQVGYVLSEEIGLFSQGEEAIQ